MIKKLSEAKKVSVSVVYLTNGYSKTIEFTEKNYKDYSKIMKELDKEFKDNANTDDYWVDDIWVDGLKVKGINWKEFFSGKDRGFSPDKLEMFFEEDVEEFAVKVQFLNDQGFDITEDNLNEVIVWGEADNLKDGNFSQRYPEDFVDEYIENYYPSLLKELEKANAYSYFEGARLVSDNEINGSFSSQIIGDYFVYSHNV